MKKKLKILFASDIYYPYIGGISEHIYHLKKELEKKGHKVYVLTAGYDEKDYPDYKEEENVIRIGKGIPLIFNKSVGRVAFSARGGKKIKKIIEEGNYDIIHTHGPLAPMMPYYALKHSNTYNFATFHAAHDPSKLYELFKKYLIEIFKKIHGLIAVSPVARDSIKRHFDGEYRIIPNGVDVERFNPSKKGYKLLPKDKKIVLFVGRFEQRKGFKYLRKAFKKVIKEVKDAHLVAVGTGPLLQLEKQKAKVQLKDKVTFLGRVSFEDLPHIYASSHIFCSPAIGYESFGIVLLEAMASGIPVVASNIEGYRFVFEDEREGLFFEPKNHNALADKLIYLLKNEDLRIKMGFLGRKKAEEEYSWNKIAKKVEEYYFEVTERVEIENQFHRGIYKVIKNKNFLIYSLSQTVSLIGDKLDHMALIALIRAYAFGHSLAFSHLAFFFTLPAIIFGPVAGIIADRINRKKILVFGDMIRAFLVLMIPFSVLFFKHLFPMYILVFFIFLIGILYNSTKMAIVPSLLKSDSEILAANSILTLTGRIATVIGLFLGGLIVDWEIWRRFKLEGWQAGFYLDAITFFIFVLFLMLVIIPEHKKEKKKEDLAYLILEKERNYFQKAILDLKEAFKLILKDKNVSFVLFSILVLVFLGATVYILIVILVQQFLGFGTTGVGKLGALTAFGMAIGAFFFGTFGDKWNRKNVIIYSFFLLSIMLMIFPFLKKFLYIGILSFLGGLLLSSVTISQDTLLHENVPQEFRGRIFASKELLLNGSFLFLSYPFGILAELIYPAKIIFFNGIILFLLTLFFFFRTK